MYKKNVSYYACLGNYYPYIHNTYVMSYMSIVYVPKISHSYYILSSSKKVRYLVILNYQSICHSLCPSF